jgi:hypothetical protein
MQSQMQSRPQNRALGLLGPVLIQHRLVTQGLNKW